MKTEWKVCLWERHQEEKDKLYKLRSNAHEPQEKLEISKSWFGIKIICLSLAGDQNFNGFYMFVVISTFLCLK